MDYWWRSTYNEVLKIITLGAGPFHCRGCCTKAGPGNFLLGFEYCQHAEQRRSCKRCDTRFMFTCKMLVLRITTTSTARRAQTFVNCARHERHAFMIVSQRHARCIGSSSSSGQQRRQRRSCSAEVDWTAGLVHATAGAPWTDHAPHCKHVADVAAHCMPHCVCMVLVAGQRSLQHISVSTFHCCI